MIKFYQSILAYFDIFDHPLSEGELELINSRLKHSEALKIAVANKQLFECEGFYGINANIIEQVAGRKEKQKAAEKYFKNLPFYTSIIKSFPFVKGIAISGSLSKGVMHEDGDIDYFIITKQNRLWICRTLLILFKKIFLLNSRKYFCVNYFVDENNLEIFDKNIFTAVEISFLLPVYNRGLFKQMKAKNNWVEKLFPTFKNTIKVKCYEGEAPLKLGIERIINLFSADRLDFWLMSLTYKRWSKKFNHFDPDKLELTMRSNRGVSKHHPRDFQNNVLKAYQERIDKLKIDHESIILP